MLLLTVSAAIPRFYQLGNLSLYADEDYTALSALSLLRGEGSTMPTGLPYRRALPLTWLTALVTARLGPDRAESYRVVPAAIGSVTPAILYLTGTAFVSPPAAFVGSAMLALSEWHIAFSRYGRMYTGFLLFSLLASFFFWQWVRRGQVVHLIAGLTCFLIGLSLHLLTLMALQFLLIPLVIHGRVAVAPKAVIAVAVGAAGIGYTLQKALILSPYRSWGLPPGFRLEGFESAPTTSSHFGSLGLTLLLLFVGAATGAWLARRLVARHEGKLPWASIFAVFAASTAACVFTLGGHLWGATLAGVTLMLLLPSPPWSLWRNGGRPLILVLLVALGWAVAAIGASGLSTGLRRLLTFPFPYAVFLWSQFPGLMVLFALSILWAITWASHERSGGLRASVLAVLLPMTALGLVSAWGGTRYLFYVYPFMLLCAGAVLVGAGEWLGERLPGARSRKAAFALGLASLAVLSGVTGGHGVGAAVRTATLEHGQRINPHMHMTPFRPDHRTAGEFVRERLRTADLVIAEEPILQYFYIGRVDYWFRHPNDARQFLYLGEDGLPRDIYVGSALLPTAERVEDVVMGASGRVWFITSGETEPNREWYLSENQRRWLANLEDSLRPSFVGRDGVTTVYCLNCDRMADDSTVMRSQRPRRR